MLLCENIEREDRAPWTDDDTEALAELVFQSPRLHISVIAQRLGRTVSAVQGQISRTGMGAPGAQLRRCLGECDGKMFYSSWIGNRRCHSCSLISLRYAS